MNSIKIAAIQMACTSRRSQNLKNAEELVRKAALKGAKIILLQELFETLYFCQEEDPKHFELAKELKDDKAVKSLSKLAAELNVVFPVSFFEKKNQVHYNSVAVIDADGSVMGIYRKTHIPDGPGYEEKYYFNPGDTGFKVWKTKYASIGVGICWDQWFPESARCMALMGAEILFYPTAIGSEPMDASHDSKDHWQTCMCGHSAANLMPVVASNRIGTETFGKSQITFYGSSFITDNTGKVIVRADRETQGIIIADLDLDKFAKARAEWGVFRDRRPIHYKPLMTLDGNTPV